MVRVLCPNMGNPPTFDSNEIGISVSNLEHLERG